MKSKKYFYTYEDYEDGDKNSLTLAKEILEDTELSSLQEIIVGCWGECYDNSIDDLLEGFIKQKEKLQHIESFFIGDMDFEECEVSWIVQGNYEKFLKAFPNLKSLKIKGSAELSLGKIDHNNLETLEIICGGLPKEVILQIANANLPALKKLNLYLGVEDYGFDGDIEDIETLLKADFIPKLEYLGLGDSEIQDEITELVFSLDTLSSLKILDLSNGTLTDRGGEIILNNIDKLKSLEMLNLEYHYLSDDMMEKLKKGLECDINLDEQQEADVYDDEVYYNPMLTE